MSNFVQYTLAEQVEYEKFHFLFLTETDTFVSTEVSDNPVRCQQQSMAHIFNLGIFAVYTHYILHCTV